MKKEYLALKNFEHLKYKRHRYVFEGDHEDAERCKKLKKKLIECFGPSQTDKGRYPQGTLRFTSGRGWLGNRLYDIARGTINGQPVYVFEYSEHLSFISRRLTSIDKLREYCDRLELGDLQALVTIVLEDVDPVANPEKTAEGTKHQLDTYRPMLGLSDLEALVEAAKPLAVRPPSLARSA